MYKEKECLGKCPKCGSDEIGWQGGEIQDEAYSYVAQCCKCGQVFTEEYKLVYVCSVIRD